MKLLRQNLIKAIIPSKPPIPAINYQKTGTNFGRFIITNVPMTFHQISVDDLKIRSIFFGKGRWCCLSKISGQKKIVGYAEKNLTKFKSFVKVFSPAVIQLLFSAEFSLKCFLEWKTCCFFPTSLIVYFSRLLTGFEPISFSADICHFALTNALWETIGAGEL